jgi:hypothetical protein
MENSHTRKQVCNIRVFNRGDIILGRIVHLVKSLAFSIKNN